MAAASIWWSQVRKMLDLCAIGWSETLKLHHPWVTYGGRAWKQFPKGPGTGGRDYEVTAWQVRRLIQYLRISMTCAKAHLPALGPIKDTDA